MIGRQWHLPINGTRNSNVARQADSQWSPILHDGKIPIGSPAFNSFPGTQWPTYFWAPDSVFLNH